MLLPLLLAGAACDGDPTAPAPTPITGLPRELSLAERQVIQGSNDFAFALLREVRAATPDSPNTFLSPLSASMALGMTLNGAAGETWRQMRDVLGFDGMEEDAINGGYHDLMDLLLSLDPAVEIGLGNAVWVDREYTLLDDFRERLATWFDADAATLDFHAAGTPGVMNAWVDSVTHGRIDRLIDQIPPHVIMYLVNAIYFHGDWRETFDRRRTAPAPFTPAAGGAVTVDMMAGEVARRVIFGGGPDGVGAVELPYGGGAFSAVLVLPPANQGIDAFVASLEPGQWDAWMETFDAQAEAESLEGRGILVRMPRIELTWGGSLVGPLQAMGMVDAFDPALADLSRMTGAPGLFVDQVLQKSFLRVDEEGTEAAAATAVGVGVVSAPPSLTFDRPFLFAIRERFSGAILFMGVIGDPS